MNKQQDPLEDFCKNLEIVGSRIFKVATIVANSLFSKLAAWLAHKAK